MHTSSSVGSWSSSWISCKCGEGTCGNFFGGLSKISSSVVTGGVVTVEEGSTLGSAEPHHGKQHLNTLPPTSVMDFMNSFHVKRNIITILLHTLFAIICIIHPAIIIIRESQRGSWRLMAWPVYYLLYRVWQFLSDFGFSCTGLYKTHLTSVAGRLQCLSPVYRLVSIAQLSNNTTGRTVLGELGREWHVSTDILSNGY